MSSVKFEHVTKRFDDVVAVDDLELEVHDREFMVLLGPSGCGKSTALRMVAGLETVSDGTLYIGDQAVNDVEAKDRDIAMVFQSYALYPHMTVRQNIEVPLKTRAYAVDGGAPRKLGKDERAERVVAAAGILGLEDLLDRKPGALSGGQRQRVALARSIVRRPQVFLMDEPLSNLDAKLRAQTRVELVELHREIATTIIYVTHDQVEAMTMADRIAVLDQGRLQQVGTPREIYGRPANLFVARFIGSPPMNTLAGDIRGDADGRVVSGVRPEDLEIRPEGEGLLSATVRAVEWLGAERQVHCEVGGEAVIARDTDQQVPLEPGQPVGLFAKLDDIHLFDAETTARIE